MEHTTFTDSDGVVWAVREDGADDPRALTADVPPGTTWLRFESELEVKRLWHYPDDWRGLSPLQLESLLDRASTVIARFRPATHRGAGGSTTLDQKRSASPDGRPTPNRADSSSTDPSTPRQKK
jgi:hypothetical protein